MKCVCGRPIPVDAFASARYVCRCARTHGGRVVLDFDALVRRIDDLERSLHAAVTRVVELEGRLRPSVAPAACGET